MLDVGSGCGVIAASAAYLVGKAGAVTGVDVRRAAVTLGRENLARLEQSNSDFAASAAACKFHLHNVFMPLRKHLVSLGAASAFADQLLWSTACNVGVTVQRRVPAQLQAVDDSGSGCCHASVCSPCKRQHHKEAHLRPWCS